MKNLLFYSLGVLFLFVSCFKKKDEDLTLENYEADWALQVINSEFNIADLLDASDTNNLNIQIIGDDIILSYLDTASAPLSDEYYKLQNQSFTGEYVNPSFVPAFLANGQIFGPEILDFSTSLPSNPLDVNGVDIKDANLREILIETGEFVLSIENTFQHPLTVDLEIPSITLDGKMLKFSDVLVDAGGTILNKQSIAKHIVNLKDKTTGALNSIEIKARISGELVDAPLNIGDKLAFSLEMKDVAYEHIIGQLGSFSVPLDKGSDQISLFDDIGFDGEFHIETFGLKLTTITDWGVPLALMIEDLTFNSETESSVTIDCYNEPFDIAALSDINLVGVESVETVLEFNTSDCPQLSTALNIRPNNFEYDLSFSTNPEEISSEDFFISKNSTVETIMEGQFYLHGYLRGFSRGDTISDIDLSGGENDIDGAVEKAALRFIIENGMPLELGIDLYFLDEDDNVVDQELDKINIESSTVDNDGYTISSSNNIIDVIIGADRMATISNKVNKIVMVSKLETTGAQENKNVHVRPQDKMKVIIGIRATLDVDLN